MLLRAGVGEIVGCDTHGMIHTERDDWDEMHPLKRWYAENRLGPLDGWNTGAAWRRDVRPVAE